MCAAAIKHGKLLTRQRIVNGEEKPDADGKWSQTKEHQHKDNQKTKLKWIRKKRSSNNLTHIL